MLSWPHRDTALPIQSPTGTSPAVPTSSLGSPEGTAVWHSPSPALAVWAQSRTLGSVPVLSHRLPCSSREEQGRTWGGCIPPRGPMPWHRVMPLTVDAAQKGSGAPAPHRAHPAQEL